jgi:hypothetical protein
MTVNHRVPQRRRYGSVKSKTLISQDEKDLKALSDLARLSRSLKKRPLSNAQLYSLGLRHLVRIVAANPEKLYAAPSEF